MKKFIFSSGNIVIDKFFADELRENIKKAANYNKWSNSPFPYDTITRDIFKKMADLCDEYEFYYENEAIDFKSYTTFMFSQKVLKDLFSDKAKNSENYIIRSKNLDILSFYAYGKPWQDVLLDHKKEEEKGNENVKENNHEISNDSNQPIIEQLSPESNITETPSIQSNTFKFKSIIMIAQYPIFLAIIIFFGTKYFNIRSQITEKDREYQKLREIYQTHENQYQSTIRWLSNDWLKFNKFDYKYYDTAKAPKTTPTLFLKRFIIDTSFHYMNNATVEIIKSNCNFINPPGIKDCNKFGGSYAFGFGNTDCPSDCLEHFDEVPYYKQPYCVIFRVNFNSMKDIEYISFQWVQLGRSWGSQGCVFVNNKLVGDPQYQRFGNNPASNFLIDETVRNFKSRVNERASYVDIVVWDITNESEIFIDNILISGK